MDADFRAALDAAVDASIDEGNVGHVPEAMLAAIRDHGFDLVRVDAKVLRPGDPDHPAQQVRSFDHSSDEALQGGGRYGEGS
jgi:hypothetical protein